MIPVQYAFVGVGLLVVALSVPLIVRMVPMNRWYGVRTRKAFASEDNWYELNAYGGKLLVVFGMCMAAAGALIAVVAPSPTSIWQPVLVLVPVLVLIPVILLIKARGKRLPG